MSDTLAPHRDLAVGTTPTTRTSGHLNARPRRSTINVDRSHPDHGFPPWRSDRYLNATTPVSEAIDPGAGPFDEIVPPSRIPAPCSTIVCV